MSAPRKLKLSDGDAALLLHLSNLVCSGGIGNYLLSAQIVTPSCWRHLANAYSLRMTIQFVAFSPLLTPRTRLPSSPAATPLRFGVIRTTKKPLRKLASPR